MLTEFFTTAESLINVVPGDEVLGTAELSLLEAYFGPFNVILGRHFFHHGLNFVKPKRK